MTTQEISQSNLQKEADLVSAFLEGALSTIPRKFVERVRLDQVQCYSVGPGEEFTIADYARSLADIIKKAAAEKAIQFVRMDNKGCPGLERVSSTVLDFPPVGAMAVGDILRGKILKRFDVRLIIHDTAV